MSKRTAYRPVSSKVFPILGAAVEPDASKVFVCEGIARPRRGARWRLVAVIERATYCDESGAGAERAIRRKIDGMARRDPAKRAALLAELSAARRNVERFADFFADRRLGVAFVPGDCPDISWC